MADPRAGQPAQPQDLVDLPHLVTAYYTQVPEPERRRAAGGLRHQRAPRLVARHGVQRVAHPRDDAGDLRLPQAAGLRRPAVHRPRHPRALRAGVGHRARGAGRQRRDGAGRQPRPLHADARRSRTRSSAPTEGKSSDRLGAGRRDRGDAVAQPAQRRRLQVQPAARRPRRHRRDVGDRRPRQRADQGRARRRTPDAVREGARRRQLLRLHGHLRRRPAVRGRPRPRSRRPASGSAPTRSAARRSTTGPRSPPVTGSTSPW